MRKNGLGRGGHAGRAALPFAIIFAAAMFTASAATWTGGGDGKGTVLCFK